MADRAPLIRRARALLGTFVEIALPERAEAHFETGFAAISLVHDCMSFHAPNSDISRINSAKPGAIVDVDRHLILVLRAAEALRAKTNGLFDITVGRALVRDGFLPRPSGARLPKFSGSADDIVIVDDRRLFCRQPVLIDLGGIAKGYAVDFAVESLRAAGVDGGIVNAGGDLRVFGPHPHMVQIRNGIGQIASYVPICDCAIATSSNLATRKKRRGVIRTPHIGPLGQPVLIDGTISVIASTCMIADAMTKIAMTDPNLAEALLAEHRGRIFSQALDVIPN